METQIQMDVVRKLEKRGFYITGSGEGIEPNTVAVRLTKRVRYSLWMGEVEADGTINGQSYADFLKGVK